MPGWMQAIASRNPLNWVVQIGRSAVAAQPDWGAIAVRCGGLFLLAVACVTVSVVTFRSYQKNVLRRAPARRRRPCASARCRASAPVRRVLRGLRRTGHFPGVLIVFCQLIVS
jgi:hypothetical protein